jgi:hypothetical protein
MRVTVKLPMKLQAVVVIPFALPKTLLSFGSVSPYVRHSHSGFARPAARATDNPRLRSDTTSEFPKRPRHPKRYPTHVGSGEGRHACGLEFFMQLNWY